MLNQLDFSIVIAAAGIAEMTHQEQREQDLAIRFASLVPLIMYVLVAGMFWSILYRGLLRSRRVSVQSVLVATTLIAPMILLVKLVAVPHWWYD